MLFRSIFPTRVQGLALQGRGVAEFDALATDMRAMSAALGRRLDGVLGHSFLVDKVVLVDYLRPQVVMLQTAEDAPPFVQSCRKRWSVPLQTVESFPVIPDFRIGEARAPVSLDTGSSGALGLFPSGLALPGVRTALREVGVVTRTGARGEAKSASYALEAPVGFGPFAVPPGLAVSSYAEGGSAETRVGNVGNKLLAAMKLKLLLDYRGGRITFFGDCD